MSETKYYECAIPSVQFAIKTGEMVAISNRYFSTDRDDIIDEIKASHRNLFVEIDEKQFSDARARQALNDPQDLLREEIRQQVLAEVLAQTNTVGSISTTAGAGQVQDGFRKEVTSPETAKSIGAAIAASKAK